MSRTWGQKQNPASGKLAGVELEEHRGRSNDTAAHVAALAPSRANTGTSDLDEWSRASLLVCRDSLALIELDGVTYERLTALWVYAECLDVVDTPEARGYRAAAYRYERALGLKRPTLTQRASAFVHRSRIRRRSAGLTP